MPQIIIKNFGPIKSCKMSINDFTVLTGEQGSGKSTIAKCIFFFRNIKNDIYSLIIKNTYFAKSSIPESYIENEFHLRLIQILGNSNITDDIYLRYDYSKDTYIEISGFKKQPDSMNYLALQFVFSDNIKKLFDELASFGKEITMEAIDKLFSDEYETIFIPAGRSIISLMSSQLNYIFATMDDEQKSSIDYCTQKYIERIIKIRPLFSNGLDVLADEKMMHINKIDTASLNLLKNLSHDVLKGRYIYANNYEYLSLDNGKRVSINYSSSGQQETVWLFNILFHLLVNKKKAFIIIEEPEAHLYPEAQCIITNALALMSNNDCQLFVTTHSPYILGQVNNLIYADYLGKNKALQDKADLLVNKKLWIQKCKAYFVKNGKIQSCIDGSKEKLIKNEIIDGASEKINDLYDNLFELELNMGE